MVDPENVKQLRNLLVSIGAVSVKAEYRGGNDEGWIQPITITYADDHEEEVGEPDYYNTMPTNDAQAAIAWLIANPIHEKYESFDGNFECDGNVSFTILDSELTFSGEETQWVDAWTHERAQQNQDGPDVLSHGLLQDGEKAEWVDAHG